MVDSHFLLHNIEEHLMTLAYYADSQQRVAYVLLTGQYKLARAMKVVADFCNTSEVKQLVGQLNISSCTQSALQVLVERLAKD